MAELEGKLENQYFDYETRPTSMGDCSTRSTSPPEAKSQSVSASQSYKNEYRMQKYPTVESGSPSLCNHKDIQSPLQLENLIA
jgi:hypothetical protein